MVAVGREEDGKEIGCVITIQELSVHFVKKLKLTGIRYQNCFFTYRQHRVGATISSDASVDFAWYVWEGLPFFYLDLFLNHFHIATEGCEVWYLLRSEIRTFFEVVFFAEQDARRTY